MASHQQGTSYSGITSIEVGECSGRTAGLDPVPIGDSVPLSQNRSDTLHTITYPIEAFCSLAHLSSKHQVFLGELDKEKIPATYEEACMDHRWVNAMNEEIQSMEKNETWEMASLPKGKKIVGCRWVFTIKYKSTGEIERYKARLVAKGFSQVYGEDYTETFAPVAKLHSVRVLLSVAVNLEWELFQMDVKNAFLQGDLEEEVYMAAPPGYLDTDEGNKICKLKKAIYGLKQSPRAWYQKLSSCLLGQGFQRSEADHSLFTIRGNQGMVVVLIYVDDIIITGDDDEGIRQTKILLKGTFDIKDLGELKYFLGIEMVRSKEGMFISQRKYTLDLLSETGKLAAKPASTPIEDGYKDDSEEELWSDIKQYQRLVGKLIYLTITRPDICFAVSQISKHMQAPTKHHWGMAERILRYLKSNPGKGIWMGCNQDVELIGYCDSDWAGDRMDRKSTTGYCTFIGGNLVTWRSKKQNVVSLSSAEAEYRAMKDVTKELIWLRYILEDLGIFKEKPITLYCDNMAAIHIASNPMFHERTKHIERDCHFVREKVLEGIIQPLFVKSGEQRADIFTKAASTQVCDYLHSKIGLIDIHQPTLRGNVENHTHEEAYASSSRGKCEEATELRAPSYRAESSELPSRAARSYQAEQLGAKNHHTQLGSEETTELRAPSYQAEQLGVTKQGSSKLPSRAALSYRAEQLGATEQRSSELPSREALSYQAEQLGATEQSSSELPSRAALNYRAEQLGATEQSSSEGLTHLKVNRKDASGSMVSSVLKQHW